MLGAQDSKTPSHPPIIPTIDLHMAQANDTSPSREEYRKISANGPLSEDINHYKGPRLWRAFAKNWPIISQPLALLIAILLGWAIAYTILPDYTAPSSALMRIAYLFIGAQISGVLVTFIHLPDMLGMLFWGVFYTNVGLGEFAGYEGLEAFLREMALVNIMLLAGLGLDLKALKKLFGMIMRLTIIPTVAEVVIIAVLAHFLLQMPWLWGFLLGLIITAVSPNVVVTVMLKLKEEKLGLNGGIHTLIYAMTTCNDVISIFVFGIMLGVIFSTGTLTEQLLQGPVGIGIGVVFGGLYGLLVTCVPSKKSPLPGPGIYSINVPQSGALLIYAGAGVLYLQKYANGLRFILTFLGGIISVMGSKAFKYPSAGALGCVMVSLVSGIGWQREGGNSKAKVVDRLDLLWKFLKPISFALIGKEVNFSLLDPAVVGYGVLLILVGSMLRLSASYLSTYGGELTWKERVYVTISGLPKATVQAALGPIAMDLARSLEYSSTGVEEQSAAISSGNFLQLANNVLVISVLAIIFTAPLGAVLMIRLAPVLLKKSTEVPESVDGGEMTASLPMTAGNEQSRSNGSNAA